MVRLGCGVAAVLALGAAPVPAPAGRATGPDPPLARPSLLLVTLDTTRADRIGCYGAHGAATPTLDGLARRGVRFAEAISPAPLTLPSHATILTGRSPRELNVRDNGGYHLSEREVTLAERLRDSGYRTAAFVSALVLHRATGIAQGFGHFDDRLPLGSAATPPGLQRDARQAVDAAAGYLADLEPPYFLWIHFYDPHLPYRPPEPYASRFAGRPYDGEIAHADAELGRLLTLLAARGLERNLVVAVAGDHGESLGEHGEAAHDVFIYQATQRVPLLLAGPGVPSGVVIAQRVGLIDVAPTLAELLGVPFGEARGRSLVALLAETQAGSTRQTETATYELESVLPARAYGWSPLFGAVRGSLKYIDAPRPELYDLERDPAETSNLLDGSKQDPATAGAAESGRALAAWVRERFGVDARAEFAARAHAGGSRDDPERRAQLEALGYAGGARPASGSPALDPKDGIALIGTLDRARELLSSGRPAEAALAAQRVLARDPRNREARRILDEAQRVRGRRPVPPLPAPAGAE